MIKTHNCNIKSICINQYQVNHISTVQSTFSMGIFLRNNLNDVKMEIMKKHYINYIKYSIIICGSDDAIRNQNHQDQNRVCDHLFS